MKKALCLLCSLCFPVILTAALQHTYTFNAAKQPYYRNTTLGFGYMNVLYHPKSKLEMPEGSMLQVATLNYSECLIECARNLSCFSINFGRQPIFIYQGEVQYLCQLLPTDKYNLLSNYEINNQEFDHYSIKSDCNNSPCPHNSPCRTNYVNDTYECLCPRPPFQGQHCKDVDECTTGQHDCDVNAECINTIGSFDCNCKVGFHGNGRNCAPLIIALTSKIFTDYGNDSYGTALKTFMDQVPEDIVSTPWRRCWSGINDGFDVKTTFHPQCDGKKPTVTLVRKNQYIWGGYTDKPWASPGPESTRYSPSTKSFIFSLYNIQGFSPKRFKHSTSYATVGRDDWGPTFGGSSKDIKTVSFASTTSSNHNRPFSYEAPPGCTNQQYCKFFTGIEGEYTIDDIEVFYKN